MFGFAIKVLNKSLKSLLKNYDFFCPNPLTKINFVLHSFHILIFMEIMGTIIEILTELLVGVVFCLFLCVGAIQVYVALKTKKKREII